MKVGKSVKIKKSKCTNCGDPLDHAAGLDHDESPSPSDATVCLHCGHIMVYDDNLNLRELTDKEVIERVGNKEIVEFQKKRGYIYGNKKKTR